MIGKISGVVDYVAEDHALIECAGVGYLVYASPRTLARLPKPGGRAALYTELVVRDDALTLLGFTTLLEKEWHRLLTSVQGVGAKASLSVLDTLTPEGVSRAIAMGDWSAIRAAPGVGPKLAQRIVNELKDKAPNVLALGARAARQAAPAEAEDGDPAEPARPEAAATRAAEGAQADAVSALLNLGVGAAEAVAAVAGAAESERGGDAAALIRAALRRLGSGG